jgi:hypothetical protein
MTTPLLVHERRRTQRNDAAADRRRRRTLAASSASDTMAANGEVAMEIGQAPSDGAANAARPPSPTGRGRAAG